MKTLNLLLLVSMVLLFNRVSAAGSREEEWTKYNPPGIAVSVARAVTPKDTIVFSIKNLSSTVKVFSDFGRDHGIKIHFIDEKGTRHELHRQPQAIISPSNDSIEPGKTLCFSIDLTQNDAGILETRQITYKFLIYDPTTYERVWVESKPLSLSGG